MRGDSSDLERPRSTCGRERLPGRSCLCCEQRPGCEAPAASCCLMPGEPVTPPPPLHRAPRGRPQRGFSQLWRHPTAHARSSRVERRLTMLSARAKALGDFHAPWPRDYLLLFLPWEELSLLHSGLILHQLLLACFSLLSL